MGLTTDPDEARNSGTDPETGMQNKYVVLSEEERAKGLVRPVRTRYEHALSAGGCGAITWLGADIAETYARQPDFYTHTYCGGCKAHHPVGKNGQFYWEGTDEKVGT
jgi:hypothetical protein